MVFVEIALVSAFLLFCINKKVVSILYLMMVLLPLHGTIKTILFSDGGNIFAVWKEIGIFFILLKTRKMNSLVSSLKGNYLIFAIYCLMFLLIGIDNGYVVSGGVKKIFFPFLLLWGISKIDFTRRNIEFFFFTVFLGSIFINIFGVIDFFSPSMRMVFRNLMHAGYTIASDGTIYYDTTSYKIMGFDRICGLMAGGPNQFGVFNSAIVLLSLLYNSNYINRGISKTKKYIWVLATILSVWMLLVSFSRAGWAIVAITLFIQAIFDKKYRAKALVALFVVTIVLAAAMFLIPQVYQVVEGTFTGKEASSAMRAQMTQDSMHILLENPFGSGLGASDHGGMKYMAFAESAMINFGYEIGIIGILMLSILMLKIEIKCWKNRNRLSIAKFGYSFLIAYYITSWVSVNPYENPFVYYAWMIIGLSLNKTFNKIQYERFYITKTSTKIPKKME